MGKRPLAFTIALGFILLNAVIWLAFAVVWLFGGYPYISVSPEIMRMMGVLAAITGVMLIILVTLLRKRNKLAYYLSLAALAIVFLLTIFDEVGFADLVYLAIALTPFVLLLISRKWYLTMDK
ncbi:MAG: hypothetical protein JXR32_02605 [Anaerolineaceae bacterium]|nr:hypothetical protein [Anaerolineaceae bacterium]